MKLRTQYIGITLVIFCATMAPTGFSRDWQRVESELPAPKADITGTIQANVFATLPIVALQEGYFADEGLRVILKQAVSGKQVMAALLDGEADFAVSAGVPIVHASFQRKDIAVFATIGYSDTSINIVGRRDRGISSPKDLVGKTIAIQKFSAAHLFLDLFLSYNGIEPAQINYLFVEPDRIVPEVLSGKADALAMRDPYTQRALRALGKNGISFADATIYRQFFSLVASKEFLNEEGDTVKSMLKALIKASEYVRLNPKSAQVQVSRFLKNMQKKEVIAAWPNYRFGVYLRQSLLLAMEGEARWLQNKRQIYKGQVVNYLDYIHTSALRNVAPYLTAIRQ